MGYRHIENLYKNREIFLFKECYASEKIHGTSSHIHYRAENDKLTLFSGGSKYDTFAAIFDQEALLTKFRENQLEHPLLKHITIYGEAYGGSQQGMSHTYGPDLKFIAFEVMLMDECEHWMTMPRAETIATRFGLDFVPYKLIPTTEEAINAEMMADSIQAVKNGMGTGHMREGIVLRPTIELIHPNGGRIISKHKRDEFKEREHQPKIMSEEALKVLEEANEIANEFVNTERLKHVLDKLGIVDPQIQDTKKVIDGMREDVYREGDGEFVKGEDVVKAIGKKTAKIFRDYLKTIVSNNQ